MRSRDVHAEQIESMTFTNWETGRAVLVVTPHPDSFAALAGKGTPITDQTYRDEAEQVARFLRKVFCLKTTDYIKEML